MRSRVALLTSFLLFTTCRAEDVRDARNLGFLAGRCIHLEREMFVLEPVSKRDLARRYLATSTSSVDREVMRLPRGSHVQITKALYERSIEYTTVVVLVRVPQIESDVDALELFDALWLRAATVAEEGGRQDGMANVKLNRSIAAWCNEAEASNQ